MRVILSGAEAVKRAERSPRISKYPPFLTSVAVRCDDRFGNDEAEAEGYWRPAPCLPQAVSLLPAFGSVPSLRWPATELRSK